MSVSGGCLCGAVRFRLEPPLRDVVLCHCGMCRRHHGHVGAYTSVAHAQLAFETQRGLRWYRSSAIARRGFCAECGSTLFWERDGAAGISVAAGTLDAPTGLGTTAQIFVADAGDYYALDPALPAHARGLGGE